MHPFTFRLEQVVRLRVAERDKRRAALAAATRVVEQLEAQQHQLRHELGRLHKANREAARPGRIDADYFRQAAEFEKQLSFSQSGVDARYEAARREAETCHDGLMEAERDVKALENLRERQLQTHRVETARRELQQQDEAIRSRRSVEPPGLQGEAARSFGWG